MELNSSGIFWSTPSQKLVLNINMACNCSCVHKRLFRNFTPKAFVHTIRLQKMLLETNLPIYGLSFCPKEYSLEFFSKVGLNALCCYNHDFLSNYTRLNWWPFSDIREYLQKKFSLRASPKLSSFMLFFFWTLSTSSRCTRVRPVSVLTLDYDYKHCSYTSFHNILRRITHP